MDQTFDLSVILTAHDETLVCGPTITSANDAVAAAQAAGITVERIVVLDNATDATKAWYAQPALDDWTRLEFEEGDLGRVRNAVLPVSKGRYIAFLDADDLFSENWLRDGVLRLREAEAKGERAIAHPELNWLFDGANSVYLKPDQDEPLFTPWHFYAMNYYDSLCMCPREAHLEHPYVHRDIPNGLSFQDWHFSIETMGAGWKHLSVRDTIIFKRRRDESLVSESRNRRSLVRQLDPMAIDRVAQLGADVPRRASDPALREKYAPHGAQGRVLGAAARLLGLGDKPAPEAGTPHYGATFAAKLAEADKAKGRVPAKLRMQYGLIARNFDVAYYLARYRDIRKLADFDPVAHYLRAGWKEGRDPAPWFSTKAYLDRYPDVKKSGENPLVHWVTKGWKQGYVPRPVKHFDTVAEATGLTPAQALEEWRARYDDLQARFAHGALGAQVTKAAAHDPLVEGGWLEAFQIKIPPFHSDVVCARTATMWRLSQAAGGQRAKHVICVNRARFGGAARIEGHLARSLAARDGAENVLVITTDQAGPMPAGKFPEGIRIVDFADVAQGLKPMERERLLAEFLRVLHPDCVYNVNARLVWEILGPYGKALAASMRLYACLLCNEQTDLGHWTGYPLRRFYRHFDQLAGVITDSHFLTRELRDRYLLPPEWAHRVQTVSNPVDGSIPVAERPAPGARPQIFWAGRFDAQKRPDLVVAIARALPQADFHLWGDSVMGGSSDLPEDLPANITVEDPYDRFTDLPLEKADLWLYTAAWDGVPTMLLEVAMTGVPLVGSDVGGTGEVLRDGLARAMPPDATPEAWTQAIRALLDDPETARQQALSLRETLLAERNPDSHVQALNRLLEDTKPADPAPEAEPHPETTA